MSEQGDATLSRASCGMKQRQRERKPDQAGSTQFRPFAATFGYPASDTLCGWLPRCKGNSTFWRRVGCSSLFGLFVQPLKDCWP